MSISAAVGVGPIGEARLLCAARSGVNAQMQKISEILFPAAHTAILRGKPAR
jgi:hypothetical protein